MEVFIKSKDGARCERCRYDNRDACGDHACGVDGKGHEGYYPEPSFMESLHEAGPAIRELALLKTDNFRLKQQLLMIAELVEESVL